MVLLFQGLEVPGGPQGRVAKWLERGVGMLTLEVPRGQEGLCGHHGGRSLASLVISAICRVWVKIEIRTRPLPRGRGCREGGGQEESDGAIARRRRRRRLQN